MYKKGKHGTANGCPLPLGPRVRTKVAPAKVVPSTPPGKYNLAEGMGRKIAAVLSECGDMQFAQRYKVLLDLWKMWASGDEVAVMKVVAGRLASADGLGGNYSLFFLLLLYFLFLF